MTLSRRTVLKSIPAFFVAALVPDQKKLFAKFEKRELLLNKFFIAGFQYYDGPSLINRLHAGIELALKRDPANEYDPYAVEILFNQFKLGFVPRTDNKHISRLIAQNANLSCRVIQFAPEETTWRMVRVEVGLMG
ncbi:MAG: hypothetical protein C4548_01595 [Desulfobacteraceae bacterium]|nr:MAG: hypothetical protein C4548_01595 [Desulfobacteraceae bacterium]